MFTVTESDDKASVTMSDTRWSMAFPAADLPKWLEIYRRFIRNRPSTAQFHGVPVQEIAAAMQRLGMPVPKEPAATARTAEAAARTAAVAALAAVGMTAEYWTAIDPERLLKQLIMVGAASPVRAAE